MKKNLNVFHVHSLPLSRMSYKRNFHEQNCSFTGSFLDIFTEGSEFSRKDWQKYLTIFTEGFFLTQEKKTLHAK